MRPLRQVVVGSGTGTWWEQTHLRRAVRAESSRRLLRAAPIRLRLRSRVPLVVTIHDVSFAAHPEWFTPREGARRRLLTRQAARAADLDPDRLGVLAPRESVSASQRRSTGSSWFRPGVTRRSVGPSNRSSRERIVLFVGSIFNRRRLPETIAAFAQATAGRPTRDW